MSHLFTLSKKGLKLIKAFEGFYSVDQALVTGQRVVGYGHRVRDDKAVMVTREQAEALLLEDLAPYEHMINTQVHAPLNQNKFDALVSLAFNIGPRAFENSETLHALNNGRPLDAANGFDVWRKSEIGGRIYVVDALMRRRAVEKALFLRPEAGRLAASRVRLVPTEDRNAYGSTLDADFPVYEDQLGGMVSQAPFTQDNDIEQAQADVQDTRRMPARRRDDGPAGSLTLSEVLDDEELATLDELTALEDVPFEPDNQFDDNRGPSPIAVAAAEVSERLDALIDETREDNVVADNIETEITEDWPTSLIENDPESEDVEEAIVPILHDDADAWRPEANEPDLVDNILTGPPNMDEITKDYDVPEASIVDMDDLTEEVASISANPESVIAHADNDRTGFDKPTITYAAHAQKPSSYGPYLIMIVTGLTLIGASLGAIYKGAETLLGDNGPFWASVGVMVGAMMVVGALYYVLKSIFKGQKA